LFDLHEDPGECRDLAAEPAQAGLVAEWRARMVDHLRERGEPYVINGDLGIRATPMVVGRNYPKDDA
jgi:hypothetical protein